MQTRIMPVDPRYEFMRHQILEPLSRNVDVGARTLLTLPIVRLVGHGETEKHAVAMAKRDKRYQAWVKEMAK